MRPGGTLGFVLTSVLPVAGPAGLTGVLAAALCAAAAFGLAGLALGRCFTGTGWVTAETPPVRCGVVVVATGCAGTDATALVVAA